MMVKHRERTVKIDGDFVRREAAEAVRTFFKPVVGTYQLVVEASNPPTRKSANRASKPTGKTPSR